MPKFRIQFIGRERGAIGIRYATEKTVEAPDADAAVLKLYDTHEHISVRGRVEEVPQA